MMERAHRQRKFRGTLLGVGIGDALGAPFEGRPAIAPADLDRLVVSPGPLQYTDDTHMTIGMAESFLACGGFDGEHLAGTFAGHYAAEPWRGYGAGPPEVFRLIAAGIPWHEAGRQLFKGSGSFGNGAAMRVAPAALLAYDDPSEADRLARQTGLITHAHEDALDGVALQARAIVHLLGQDPARPLDRDGLLDALAGATRSPIYRQAIETVAGLLAREPTTPEIVAALGHGLPAREAVPAALYAFLRRPDDFPAAVLGAIGLGGDTDTIAALTGALAGAYLGEAALPARWRDHVEGSAHLRSLADGLLDLAAGRR